MTKWINHLQASIIQLMIIIRLQAVKNTLHPCQQMAIMPESTIVLFFEVYIQELPESL